MTDKSSNNKTNTINEYDYKHDLIKEFKDLNDGKDTNVQINCEKRSKQAITLIQLNVQGQNSF